MILMRFAWLILLAGCAMPSGDGGYRDTSVPIAVTTRFEPVRLAGDWWVRAEFGKAPRQMRQVSYQWDGDGAFLIGPKGGPYVQHQVITGARWAISGSAPEVWLLWVDADYRTAAIGAPDGHIGMILDRGQNGGADRIKAASEILEWYGYDMTKLQETQG